LGLNDGVGTSSSTSGGGDNGGNYNSDNGGSSDTGSDDIREFSSARNNTNSASSVSRVTDGKGTRNVGCAGFWYGTASVDRIAEVVSTRVVVIAGNVCVNASSGVVARVDGTVVVVVAKVCWEGLVLATSYFVANCFVALVWWKSGNAVNLGPNAGTISGTVFVGTNVAVIAS